MNPERCFTMNEASFYKKSRSEIAATTRKRTRSASCLKHFRPNQINVIWMRLQSEKSLNHIHKTVLRFQHEKPVLLCFVFDLITPSHSPLLCKIVCCFSKKKQNKTFLAFSATLLKAERPEWVTIVVVIMAKSRGPSLQHCRASSTLAFFFYFQV